VVSACVVLGRRIDPAGIQDSKALTGAQRLEAYAKILRDALAIGVGIVDRDQIDTLNILRASELSMRLAIQCLRPALVPAIVLVDGRPVSDLPCAHARAIVGGDAVSISIAAASIVAKVTRDRMMVAYDALFPGYGFASHKGYSAAIHLEALRRLGPCPIHRRSFAPVAEMLQPRLFDVD
jgi:ribonuclease HII